MPSAAASASRTRSCATPCRGRAGRWARGPARAGRPVWGDLLRPCAYRGWTVDMAKTLVIAEKRSVARDLAAALPGTFSPSKDKTHLEGDDYVISWAVGHLVGLAEPDAYDPKLKKWRFADLPILPEEFKLVPNDSKAEKQLKAIHKLMRSPDIERIVNACDAGREGELIFPYVYEPPDADKPVERLWLQSMT